MNNYPLLPCGVCGSIAVCYRTRGKTGLWESTCSNPMCENHYNGEETRRSRKDMSINFWNIYRGKPVEKKWKVEF